MASTRFIGQPRPSGGQLGTEAKKAIGAAERVRIAVAWGKSSGLTRIQAELEELAGRGGTSEAIIGIDAQGATWDGLELARDLFTEAYIYYDPGSRTFHPKMLLAESNSASCLIVGSGNFTRGGLFTNYEAAVVMDLDLGDADDLVLRNDASIYLDWLRDQSPACQRIDAALLEALRRDSRQLVSSERELRSRAASRRSRDAATPSIFGKAIPGLGSAPGVPAARDGDDDDSIVPRRSDAASSGHTASGATGGTEPMAGASGFFKRLSNYDVSLTSSPGQMIIPIQFLDFFPDLTVQKDESPTGGPRQLAAEFQVTFVDGAFSKTVLARVIYYEPAITHPRPNAEIRFTFRDREVLGRLSADDVLRFESDGERYQVTRDVSGSHGADRFDWL